MRTEGICLELKDVVELCERQLSHCKTQIKI